jgi:hypothetical protein
MGRASANTRATDSLAILDCVQDKGNAGRLSLSPSGLTFQSEQRLLNIPLHELISSSLQESNHGDVEVPLHISSTNHCAGSTEELLRLKKLLQESRDATRLMGGSVNLSDGAPAVPSARREGAIVDDTFQHTDKRVFVVHRLALDGAAHNTLAPILSELRFVASDPNDALEFSIIVSSRLKAFWASRLLPAVHKASGNSSEIIIATAPVVALMPGQSGFFGAKSADELIPELSILCICSKGIAVGHVVVAVKLEHGYVIDKWRFVEYSTLSDLSLSLDDPLQLTFAFAKGSAWDPIAVLTSNPSLRWELCCTVQRLYNASCSGKYIARNLFAEKFHPASWAEVRSLTNASAELWLSRTGLPCLKFGRQGEPQIRVIKLNTADSTLYWNSSKKKDPLLLSQVQLLLTADLLSISNSAH